MLYTDEGERMRLWMDEMGRLVDQTYLDQRYKIYDYGFGNPVGMFLTECYINEPIVTEGLIHTYPPETTIRYISGALNIPEQSFSVEKNENGNNKIYCTYSPSKTSKKLLYAGFEYCGYRYAVTQQRKIGIDDAYITDAFEEKNPNINDTEAILSTQRHLYHVSPSYYEKKIIKNGIVPKHKNSRFNYPERVYLLDGDIDEGYILGLAYQLSLVKDGDADDNGFDIYQNNDLYSVFKIDVDKLPKNIRLFKDPNYKGGIFTPDNIPPGAITAVGHINFTHYKASNGKSDVKIIWD